MLIERFTYMLSGVSGRISQRRLCPACGSPSAALRDRKWFHCLFQCAKCHLAYRYPVESGADMAKMYDGGYNEPGLTTELPTDRELSALLASEFRNSEKDFSYHTSILKALGLGRGSRLLDYRANWGYASWQFSRAGFNVTSYE